MPKILASHWHSRILGFRPWPGNLQNLAPEGRILAPRTLGNFFFFVRRADDFSPGLEGRVGDQFWHPKGVQVKALQISNLYDSQFPLQWTAKNFESQKTRCQL